MKLVALDFSTERRSVAVTDGKDVLAVRWIDDRRAGAMGLIEAVLDDASLKRDELEGVAVGLGPGSYTGIRSSIAIAQGWQLARTVKLFGVSSVATLANTFEGDGEFLVVVDAQRGEFYCAGFESIAGKVRECSQLRIVSRDELLTLAGDRLKIVGPDAGKLDGPGMELYPDARVLAKLVMRGASPVEGSDLEPIYLRPVEFRKAPPARVIE